MKKTIATLVAAAALSGCATNVVDGLKNRVTCSAAKDKAYFLSLYWRFGISAEVDQKDAEAICK